MSRFAERYRSPAPGRFTVPGGPTDRAYSSVLTIHMAALAVVNAHAHAVDPPRRTADLSRYLLNREHRYWTALHGEHRTTSAARTAFIASVTGALPHRAGAALLRRSGLPEATGMSAQQILDAHDRCYPPMTGGTVLEPLSPDRLAEDFIALTLPSDSPDSLADPWCAGTLTETLFAREDGRVPQHAGRGLIFLAAAAANRPHVASALRSLLRADPALPVDAGGAALTAITPYVDGAIAAAISRNITDRSIDLHPAVAVLSCGIHQIALLLNSRRKTSPGVRSFCWVNPGSVTVADMTTYSGPARLILEDGTRVAGMASLSTNQRGGLDGWGGTFRPNHTSTELAEMKDGLRLELPYDEVGTVDVTRVRKLLATQMLMSLSGRGPAPF